jgi:hypothetical protein
LLAFLYIFVLQSSNINIHECAQAESAYRVVRLARVAAKRMRKLGSSFNTSFLMRTLHSASYDNDG